MITEVYMHHYNHINLTAALSLDGSFDVLSNKFVIF